MKTAQEAVSRERQQQLEQVARERADLDRGEPKLYYH